jgi:hypothetical protein
LNEERTDLSDATRKAEAEESRAPHVAYPADTPEEDDVAVEERDVDPDVRDHYREMAELGAENVGEGRIP